jgi:hypothetical protein
VVALTGTHCTAQHGAPCGGTLCGPRGGLLRTLCCVLGRAPALGVVVGVLHWACVHKRAAASAHTCGQAADTLCAPLEGCGVCLDREAVLPHRVCVGGTWCALRASRMWGPRALCWRPRMPCGIVLRVFHELTTQPSVRSRPAFVSTQLACAACLGGVRERGSCSPLCALPLPKSPCLDRACTIMVCSAHGPLRCVVCVVVCVLCINLAPWCLLPQPGAWRGPLWWGAQAGGRGQGPVLSRGTCVLRGHARCGAHEEGGAVREACQRSVLHAQPSARHVRRSCSCALGVVCAARLVAARIVLLCALSGRDCITS